MGEYSIPGPELPTTDLVTGSSGEPSRDWVVPCLCLRIPEGLGVRSKCIICSYFGRILVGKDSKSALRLAFGRPEGRFRCFTDYNPAEIRASDPPLKAQGTGLRDSRPELKTGPRDSIPGGNVRPQVLHSRLKGQGFETQDRNSRPGLGTQDREGM